MLVDAAEEDIVLEISKVDGEVELPVQGSTHVSSATMFSSEEEETVAQAMRRTTPR